MMKQLRTVPYYVFLLPVFFVLHGFAAYVGFITPADACLLLVSYLAGAAVVYGICYLVFRNKIKAGLAAAGCLACYFFFGAVFDFIRDHSPVRFLYRYPFLLSICFIALLILFITVKRSDNNFARATLFLNLLLMVYLCVDLCTIGRKTLFPASNQPAFLTTSKSLPVIAGSGKKPDIYLLLFDEYASSRSLKERFGFDNDLDSFLIAQQFKVQSHSTSNYNYTPFSMASILNMDYLHGIDVQNGVAQDDFLQCNRLIRDNEVIKFLGQNGYEIVNLSIFDLAGHPSIINQSFLPLKTRLITENTFTARVFRDFEWFFAQHHLFTNNHFFEHAANNQLLLQELLKQSAVTASKPRFIYAHLYMPHFPFFYDRYGHRKEDTTLLRELDTDQRRTPAYLEYVRYTNNEIKKLITLLCRNTHQQAAIMLMGDHGYRVGQDTTYLFQNMNAVYIPSHQYQLFYDSISTVNQFPVLFNTLFNVQFPLLKDSTIRLKDKVQ